MSRRWWLPTQKGTDLFPRTTIDPPKLIIRGVPPDSPAFAPLASIYGGRLKQFHGKQQQNYALSPSPIQRGHIEWGDARATYINHNGKEILQLEVNPVVIERLLKPEKNVVYDWAIVDVHVPVFTHTYMDGSGTDSSYLEIIAKMVVPEPSTTWTTPPGFPIDGEAGSNIPPEEYYSAEDPPILQWAYAETRPGVGSRAVTDGVEIGSLLIDLRKFSTHEDVVFDLYAGMHPVNDDSRFVVLDQAGYYVIQRASDPTDLDPEGDGTPSPETLTASTGPVPIGTPNPYTGYVDTSQVLTDFPQLGGGYLIPGLTPGTFTPVFGYYYPGGGFIEVRIPQGDTYLTNAGTPPGTWTWELHENELVYEYYRIYNWDNEDVPVDETTPNARIEAAMFMGDPDWAWSDNIDGASGIEFGLWEDAQAFPRRFATGVIARDVIIPSADGEYVEARQGLKRIGRLHCLPKQGSVTFEPA